MGPSGPAGAAQDRPHLLTHATGRHGNVRPEDPQREPAVDRAVSVPSAVADPIRGLVVPQPPVELDDDPLAGVGDVPEPRVPGPLVQDPAQPPGRPCARSTSRR